MNDIIFIENSILNKNSTDETNIHTFRRGIKRIRALLFLLQQYESHNQLKAYISDLKAISRSMTDYRESIVNYNCFIILKQKEYYRLNMETTDVISSFLQKRIDILYTSHKKRISQIVDLAFRKLTDIKLHVTNCLLTNSSVSIPPEAMKEEYLKCVEYYHLSKESRDTEILHQWRKHIKNIVFQLRLPPLSLSKHIKKYRVKLDELAGSLGNDHDMAIMYCYIAEEMDLNEGDLKSLEKTVSEVRTKIQNKSFNSAFKLFESDQIGFN